MRTFGDFNRQWRTTELLRRLIKDTKLIYKLGPSSYSFAALECAVQLQSHLQSQPDWINEFQEWNQ